MTAPGGRDFENASPATVTGMLAASELLPGDRVAGRFVIGKLLGMGGMGLVHLARDEQLGIDVALKLLRPELASRPDAFERFRNELLLARQVSSPHVVRIHDLVQHGEGWLLCMDYVPGQSLEHLIDVEGGLAPSRAIEIVRQIALGLAAAHHRGVIHRDLKPANVLVTDKDEALITDFGVARSLGAAGLTKSGIIVGTPEYLSPEQARAEPVDGRSDLYALGLILHEMLTGKVPFQGGTPAEMLAQRIVRSPPSVASVRPGLPAFAVGLCDQLLDVRPGRRPQRAEDVVRAIEAGRILRAPGQRRRQAAVLVGLLLALALAGLGWQQFSQKQESSVVGVAKTRPALALIPAVTPASGEDALLQQGAERALAMRLLAAGADVLDPTRVERSLRELGIERAQAPRMRERLLRGLDVQQALEVVVSAGDQPRAVALRLLDGRSAEVLWQQREAVANEDDVAPALDRLWQALNDKLKLTATPIAFPPANALRRLAGIAPLVGAGSVEGLPLDSGTSVDEWWWALETLERDARLTEAKSAARDALRLLANDESALAQRTRALAELLTGAPEAALQRVEQAPLGEADQPLRQLRARVLIALGRYQDAASALRELIARDPRNVDALFLLGKAQLLMGESQQAVDDALTRALISANRLSDRRMQADVVNAMGIGYRQLGQLDAASEQFERAGALRQALGDALGQANSLRNLAAVRSIQGRFAEADDALQRARIIIEPVGDPAAMADLESDVGLVAEERGDFAAALLAYREALGFRQTSGDPGWIAESLLNVGFAYYHVGEFDNAQVFLQQAAHSYSTIDDRAGAVRAEQGLALSEMARGNFAASRGLIAASLDAAEALQMHEEQSTALAALAELDRLEGNYEIALKNAGSAAAQFLERGDVRGQVEMQLLLASTQLDIGDWSGAEGSISAMAEVPIANVEQRALLLLRQARLANETGRHAEALDRAGEAQALAVSSGAAAVDIQARLEQAHALAKLERPAEAQAQLQDAESGLRRFASLTLQLDVQLAKLLVDSKHPAAYRDAQSLISKLPAYGREWRFAAAATASLPAGERDGAQQRALRLVEQIRTRLSTERGANFQRWAESLIENASP
jgi:tetratricopeptide (TPR) repeat protein